MLDELVFGPVGEPEEVDVFCEVGILAAAVLEPTVRPVDNHTHTEVLLHRPGSRRRDIR